MSTSTLVFPIFPWDKERAMPDPKGETEFTWTYLFRSPFRVPKKLMIFVFLEHSSSGYIIENRSSQLSMILIFSLRDCCGDRFGSCQKALQGKQIKSFLYMSWKARHTSKPWHHFKVALGCSYRHGSTVHFCQEWVLEAKEWNVEHLSKRHQC